MKIRRVEISGFKSFADRVVFSFDDGVTGVVGPNGCGKSNVVDAIRWAMGEQSAKHLRGRSIIEEAAGVTKYKARRKQAERKLEATEQNLLRLSDVVGEVGRRLQGLERQAKKAERFRELRGELRQLELLSACRQWLAAKEQEEVFARELQDAGDAEKVAQARVARLEAGRSAGRLAPLEGERQVQELGDPSP